MLITELVFLPHTTFLLEIANGYYLSPTISGSLLKPIGDFFITKFVSNFLRLQVKNLYTYWIHTFIAEH